MKRAAIVVGLGGMLVAASARAQEPPRGAPITLQEAVRLAIARNPSWVVAQEEIRRADALVKEARAASFPTLNGTATYTRLDSDRTIGTTTFITANAFNAQLQLTVPIIHPRNWAQWSHAEDNAASQRFSGAETGRLVALAVGHAYLAVVAQRRVLEATERARDTAKAHADFAHQRFSGGVGNRIDEVRAQQELATDESQVQTARASLAKAREALTVLVGADAPLDATDDPALAQAPSLVDAMEGARKRTDVTAAEARVRAADRVVKDDWTDYSPYLVGIGQAWYQSPASVSLPTTGWQAQLVLTIPIYDGGLRYGLADEREALRNEAIAQAQGTLRQARSDVRAAFEAMLRADDALRAARDAARLASDALGLAQLAYREGATTNIEVIDAERRARDAETSAAIAEDGARQARLDLLVASGRFP